jgi:hypothetical protein
MVTRRTWTDILDFIGILLLAAGAAYATYRWLGMACVAVAGVVVLAGSALASRSPVKETEEE